MVTAAAIGAVGAIGGAVIAGKSAEKAAKAGAEGQERAAETVSAAAERARQDVLGFFPEAQQNLLVGAQSAIDVFQSGIPIAQQQLQAGNIQAQETTARGFLQQQAALLGLPVEAFQAGAPIITGDEPPLLGQSITGTFQEFGEGGQQIIPTFRGTTEGLPLTTRFGTAEPRPGEVFPGEIEAEAARVAAIKGRGKSSQLGGRSKKFKIRR